MHGTRARTETAAERTHVATIRVIVVLWAVLSVVGALILTAESS
jgi:hypothetical protein